MDKQTVLAQAALGIQSPEWDPLESDGDAFRLLVALKMSLEYTSNGKSVDVVTPDGRCLVADANDPVDIRRAIVEAAAHVASLTQRNK